MELSVLTELINSVGFPIAMVGVFGWYINKRDNQRIEIEKETKAQEREKEAHGYKKGSYSSCGPSRDSSYCYVFVFPYREALSRQDKPRFSR